MRRYRVGSYTKTDLKDHLVWIPKYRKRVLTGRVTTRLRNVIRQIVIEHKIANNSRFLIDQTLNPST